MRGTLSEAKAREGYILCFLCFKIREVKLNSDRLTGWGGTWGERIFVFFMIVFKVIRRFDSSLPTKPLIIKKI